MSAEMSRRIKKGLARAKSRGVKLGNPRVAETIGRAHAARRAGADRFAASVLPTVREIQASGATTLAAIATALNARGVKTARGGAWYQATVRNLLLRGGTSISESV
jgi:DNA invertase Pin-like site-specific DNA recombinase